jgi:hypothetical protein
MAVELVAFVCEGPTCRDRWDSATPRQSVADGLGRAAAADGRICVLRETCLGHCQRGPSVMTMPVSESEAGPAVWWRPDESSPGARVHHPRSIAQAADLIATEVPVAANPELA